MKMRAFDNIKVIQVCTIALLLVLGGCASSNTTTNGLDNKGSETETSAGHEQPVVEEKQNSEGVSFIEEETAEDPKEYDATDSEEEQASTDQEEVEEIEGDEASLPKDDYSNKETAAPKPPNFPEALGPDRGDSAAKNEGKREKSTQNPGRISPMDSTLAPENLDPYHKRVAGSLVHTIPREMELGEISHILSKLSSAKSPETLLAKLDPSLQANATTATVEKLATYMKAELIDYNAVGEERFFEINLTGGKANEIQYLDLEDTTFTAMWDWAVKPLKEGTHPLQIKIYMNLNGEMSPTNEPVFTTIEIYSETVLVSSSRSVEIISSSNIPSQPSSSSWNIPLAALGVILLLGFPIFFIYRKRKRKKVFEVKENDNHADPEEIMMLIRNGEIEKAVGELLDLTKINGTEALKNDIILQQTRWSHLETDIDNGIISREDQRMERNKIHMALLNILDEMGD